MSGFQPVAIYGLEVPPGDILVPATIRFPASIRITMAAINPTVAPEADENGNIPNVPRSTLKIIKASEEADSDDEDDDEALERLLAGADDSEDSDEDEPNGGPSDPSKSKKARQAAAIKKLMEGTQSDESDEEMEDTDNKANGAKSKKGKAKASEDDEESDEDESGDDTDIDLEDYVVCTLDTERNYQQPIDITVLEGEQIFFTVTGTHSVFLTGNYVMPDGDESEEDYEDSDDEYDLPPGIDELDDSELSDELDEIDGVARVKEIDTDEEEAPKLVDAKKGKNKRVAEDDAEGLDDMISQDGKKLSKKQQKKLKTEAAAKEAAAKGSPASAKSDKKVQFAKELEQGPTGPAKEKDEKATDKKPAAGSVKVVQGVTIDDRKPGTGRTVKNGDKVGMRYIGKLQNGKVFDANKKGPPFTFKIGKGEVIKGWDVGIMGMAVGGERRLTIPASLAYGSKSLPDIPSNSTLIFDLKLLEIK